MECCDIYINVANRQRSFRVLDLMAIKLLGAERTAAL
jgi:hypothetical protein